MEAGIAAVRGSLVAAPAVDAQRRRPNVVIILVGRPIQPMEGVSLRPAFAGGRIRRTHPIFWEHEGNRAIRSGRWKLVSRFPDGWELYDMNADRTNVDRWPGPRLTDWGDPAPQRGERR
jgi:arylsulfatase A-like enzyme